MSPFDHPEIWEGHSTLVTELATQLPKPVRPAKRLVVRGRISPLNQCDRVMHAR